ncbi:MAG: DUF3109 family protein [Chloroflexi bacterium]|nr:DUF3109 family protein [Chloroflexota bacterium]
MNERTDRITIKDWLIDDSLLEKKPIMRCEIGECKGGCCSDGVWVDMGQAQAILEHAEMIAPYMPPERRNKETWFAEHYNDDKSFPSGEYIGTTTVVDETHPGGTTCVFLRPEDRYCAIQAASLADGMPGWELKPHYCCMFPLVDEYDESGIAKRLMLDSENSLFEHGGGCYKDATTLQPVFQVYAEETSMVLGVDGYRDLCRRTGVTPRL